MENFSTFEHLHLSGQTVIFTNETISGNTGSHSLQKNRFACSLHATKLTATVDNKESESFKFRRQSIDGTEGKRVRGRPGARIIERCYRQRTIIL